MSEASKNSEDQIFLGLNESTFSPGLVDGTLPCNSPAGPSTDKFGPQAAPVSHSHLLAKEEGWPTPDTSGRTPFGSLKSIALTRFLGNRLREKLDLVGSMEYSQTWKVKVTPAGRQLSAHTASARRISDKGFTGWPTANVPNGGRTPKAGTIGPTGMMADGTKRQVDLQMAAQLAGWPKTPQASDGDGGVMEIRPGTTGKYKLRDYAQLAGWATARTVTGGAESAESAERKQELGRTESGGGDLQAQVLGVISELFIVPTGKRVVLAPEFSLWLMGFPEEWVSAAPGAKDWQEAQAALETECSKDQGTP